MMVVVVVMMMMMMTVPMTKHMAMTYGHIDT